MEKISQIREGFTNKYGVFYPNVREISFKKGELCSKFGKFVAETQRETDSFLLPDDFDLRGVYIYQQLDNPNRAYRIYKEFAEYKFNGYSDDKLIHNLQNVQSEVKLTEFPSAVVTVDGMIIGQEIPYYYDYMTLHEVVKNMRDKRVLLEIYQKIVMILKELKENGILYTDVHPKNFMVNSEYDVKLIDFEYSLVKFESMEYYEAQFFENIRDMINMLNLNVGINSRLENTKKFESILEQIDAIKRTLK